MSNFPTSLPGLNADQAILDALYRGVYGLDINNEKLFSSAFTEDGIFTIEGVSNSDGYAAIKKDVFDNVGPMATTHLISNVRVDRQEGAQEAQFTAYAWAQHFRPEQGLDTATKNLLSGSIYTIDVVHDEKEGLWKMKKWHMKMIWLQGDMTILTG